jgi:excisionase family DNA binding protein
VTADELDDRHLLGDPRGHGERMLTTAQVADQLQLSVPLVRKAIRDGRLQASLPAGRKHGYRIAQSAIEHWMTASRAGPRSRPASTPDLA